MKTLKFIPAIVLCALSIPASAQTIPEPTAQEHNRMIELGKLMQEEESNYHNASILTCMNADWKRDPIACSDKIKAKKQEAMSKLNAYRAERADMFAKFYPGGSDKGPWTGSLGRDVNKALGRAQLCIGVSIC